MNGGIKGLDLQDFVLYLIRISAYKQGDRFSKISRGARELAGTSEL